MNNKISTQDIALHGIGISPGLAIGKVFIIEKTNNSVPEYVVPEAERGEHLARLRAAIAAAIADMENLKSRSTDTEARLLIEAWIGMLRSSRMLASIEARITNIGLNAEAAIWQEMQERARAVENLSNNAATSHAEDLLEAGKRILAHFGKPLYDSFASIPDNSIVLANDLSPSEIARLDHERVAGLCALTGGAEGHSAIMARALGIPAVASVSGLFDNVAAGDMMIVDGTSGNIIVRPGEKTLADAAIEIEKRASQNSQLALMKNLPAVTKDGTHIILAANIELPCEAEGAQQHGADGLGLLRTEFIFMNRNSLPSEDEQVSIMRPLVGRFGKAGKAGIVIRTTDIGGEKNIPGLSIQGHAESNPALGLRGIRFSLLQRNAFETQIAAILRLASSGGLISILIPMITNADEMVEVRKIIESVAQRLRKNGVKMPEELPPIGAMIEVPSAAIMADAIAAVSDFISIGSNDLTQYVLAADRSDERVNYLYDQLHPAVLRLVKYTIDAANQANIPVSLCGEIAGNPDATKLLLGLGLRSLSMAPARLLSVKKMVRETDIDEAVIMAQKAITR